MLSRRMMMAYIMSHQSRLPVEFQEVEYIKSTGTQWIDTNFNPNQDTRVVIDYQDDDITVSTHGFIGSRDNVNSGFLIGGRSTYYWYAQYGNEQTPGTIFRNDKLRHLVDLNKTLLYYDNSLLHTFSSQVFSNQKSLTLFITNDFGSTNNAIGKIFQCQIYNNDILVRNFIPCYRKADGVMGVYDTVNGVFYTNAGTGKFIAGKPIIDSAYQVVEYIESTGTQFIDTGILMQDGLEYEISFNKIQTSGPYSIAGGSGSWAGVFYTTTGPKYGICGKTGYGYYTDNSNTGIFHYKEPYYESTFNNATASKSNDNYTYTGNLYLFKAFQYDQVPDLKIYYAKVWINNTLAYDLVPCYRKSDDVIGMYDCINNVFYTNAGTGTFIKGNDI